MKPFYFAFILLLLPSVTMSQTLCREGEMDYFSCKTSNKKIISVCGNITNGEIDDSSWLQYRFGKVGAIELTYPKEKVGSVSKFEGNFFVKYGVIDLRFISGKVLYSVSINSAYSGEDAAERVSSSAGVGVQIGKAKRVNLFCTKANTVEKYYGIFSALNETLRYNNGETDIFYHFYNHISSQAPAQQPTADFPAAASSFLAQELPQMEAAVEAKDRAYFSGGLERMKAFINSWPTSFALDTYPACTGAVRDFLIAGLCRISPPDSICEAETFLPKVAAEIAKCNELAGLTLRSSGTVFFPQNS
jgi:hypothetical protein